MGNSASYKVDVVLKKNVEDFSVLGVTPSIAYNLVQLVHRRPAEYVLYDLRGRSLYMAETLRHAFWGWEKNADFDDQEEFHELLREESRDKTLLMLTDARHPLHVKTFLQTLAAAKAAPAKLMVLQGPISQLLNKRYKVACSNTTKWTTSGPLEMLAPSNLTKATGCAAFVGATVLLTEYVPAIKQFGITSLVNLSRASVIPPWGVENVEFLSSEGSVDIFEVAKAVKKRLVKKKAVLILDVTGNDYSAAVVAALLCMDGKKPDEAIQFVKIKNPHADDNFLMSVHGTMARRRSTLPDPFPLVLGNPSKAVGSPKETQKATTEAEPSNLPEDDREFLSFRAPQAEAQNELPLPSPAAEERSKAAPSASPAIDLNSGHAGDAGTPGSGWQLGSPESEWPAASPGGWPSPEVEDPINMLGRARSGSSESAR